MTNEEYKKKLDDDWDEFLRILSDWDDEEEETDDEDDGVVHSYVDEPYVDEDRLRRIREHEALGEWMSRKYI